MTKSLWGDEIVVESNTKSILEKAKTPKKVSSKKIPLATRLNDITAEVHRILGRYADNTVLLDSREKLHDYISQAIENGIIAIDTETNNSLDTFTCKLMGLCLYTPNCASAYAPVNHVDVVSRERLAEQVSEQDVYEELSRLGDTKVITHNGKFDYKVLLNTTGYDMHIYWDTLIGAKILDENERAGLKEQYRTKIDPTQEKYDIEHLFDKLEYAIVDPSVFALYAATDSFMTYGLYLYQKEQFELAENSKLYKLFMEIEMPILQVATDMELTGICVDDAYAKTLSAKYRTASQELQKKIDAELGSYKDIIAQWRKTREATAKSETKTKDGVKYGKSKSEQLSEPISLSSPTQLAILLYDVLKVEPVDKKQPRGTGEDILKQIDLPLCKLVLEQRGIEKLIGTYTDKLPECVSPRDNRLHAEFNQYGADTGRFSSSDPNLQNIPSHSKDIRMMFVARCDERTVENDNENTFEVQVGDEILLEGNVWKPIDKLEIGDIILQGTTPMTSTILDIHRVDDNYVLAVDNNTYGIETRTPYCLVGSDYSQQEPRLLAYYSGDENMRKAYLEGKDFYASIAMKVYHNKYEDNLEHFKDGSRNEAGANRRSSCKSLLLGLMYGMGAASIATRIGSGVKEAQDIIDTFYKEFPKVRAWMDNSISFAHTNGYVEDIVGRRRRLPDMMLNEYEVSDGKELELSFNPILYAVSHHDVGKSETVKLYEALLSKAKLKKDIDKIKAKALKDKITIIDNTGRISRSERQCVNARVQGGAATLSKLAMIAVHNDELLNKWGFKLLIAIHDELIGECPQINAEKVAQRLSQVMIDTAKTVCTIPMKCDAEITHRWYENEYKGMLAKELRERSQYGKPLEECLEDLYKSHPEAVVFSKQEILEAI